MSQPRENIVLATKSRVGSLSTGIKAGLSRKAIMFNVEQSLKRLKTGYIDLYYVSIRIYNYSINELYCIIIIIISSNY